jgi:hypothetical protein
MLHLGLRRRDINQGTVFTYCPPCTVCGLGPQQMQRIGLHQDALGPQVYLHHAQKVGRVRWDHKLTCIGM